MHVRRLELVDFRSYRSVSVDLEPGANVLIGPNGIGKTNLVEALGYVATLASHRVATDAPLVRAGASSAVIRCVVVDSGRELLIELELVPGKANRARLGRSTVTRVRDIVGALRLVLFAPEDIELVRGEPAGRRRYLDELLITRRPRFAAVCADYERVLKQRNALLRSAQSARRAGGSTDLSTLDAWDAQLAQHGAELLAGRLELVAALQPHVTAGYQAVAGDGRDNLQDPQSAQLSYRSGLSEQVPDGLADAGREALRESLLAGFVAARASELERGVTTVGPHRDDLALQLGELPAKGYASHGESWSYALALRLAAHQLLRADGVEPVLVLDDVFAELDAGRRERLAHRLGDAQTLVTCAVEADVPAGLRGARFEVRDGEVKRV